MIDISIDEPRTYSRLDPDDMYRRVVDLPRQIEDARDIAGRVSLPDDYRSVNSVLIAGMGGSAIGGSLLESYGSREISIPVAVWRNYELPASVDENTLVIAVSYSGNTEETLSAVHAARDRGAKLLAITTGGKLKALADEWRIPVLTFQYAAQPRATIGYLFTPLVRIFERLGFLGPQEASIKEALEVVRNVAAAWDGERATNENLAKQIATDAQHHAVVIYGADYLAAVARRWKTQMNENAKNWAFYEEFPELDHNAIVGYQFPKGFGDAVEVIMLDGPDVQERIRLRMQVTQEILDGFQVHWRVVEAQGTGRLAQMFSLIALGDYASYYLALLNGADPSTIEPINFLKDALARVETASGLPAESKGP